MSGRIRIWFWRISFQCLSDIQNFATNSLHNDRQDMQPGKICSSLGDMGRIQLLAKKNYVWFSKPDHGQLQRLTVASVLGKNCPPHTRPGTQMVRFHLWRVAVKESDPSGWSYTSQRSDFSSGDFTQVFIQDLLLPFPPQAPLPKPPYGARERKTLTLRSTP